MAGGVNVGSVVLLGYAYLLVESTYFQNQGLLNRIRMALGFGRYAQRPSGRFDLLSTNFDSGPDTAFVVQSLAPLVKAAREHNGSDGAAEIAESAGWLIRLAVPGICAGGFHTPNHRWVIVSALAQAVELFPDLEITAQIDAFLDEGIDINEDGEYTERIPGIYNAICNRSLRLAAEALGKPQLLEPVRSNLKLSYHLLRGYGTIVTMLSTRQDQGSRPVPVGLIDSYYSMARLDQNGFYASVADWLWAASSGGLPWVLHPFVDHPEWRTTNLLRAELLQKYTKAYHQSGLWRHRVGQVSATVAANTTRPFSLCFATVELALKICSTYFATGQFYGEEFATAKGGVRLRHFGRNRLYTEREYDRPVYWLPIGRTVQSVQWRAVRKTRPTFELDPLEVVLEVIPVDGGFDLRVTSSEGVDDVPFQLEFLFSPGGGLELANCVLRTMPGGMAFLKSGTASYRMGRDSISVSPGNDLHRMWQMRNSEPEPEQFRLLIAVMTPVDWSIEIRCFSTTNRQHARGSIA